MKFRFHAPEAAGLRVIPEIPDLPLCQIEGRNGIGKTLAARLLELITGGQPYAALPDAWRTLSQLGPTRVEIDEVPGGRGSRGDSMQFLLRPESWPEAPLEGLADELGDAYINGERVDWAAARRRLKVVRIAGDETLVETLGRTLQEWSVQAEREFGRTRPLAADWDHQLSSLRELCNFEWRELPDRRVSAWNAAQALASSRAKHEKAEQRNEDALAVASALSDIVARARSLPEAIGRIEWAERRQAQAQAVVRGLEARVQRAAEARAGRRELDQAVRGWERKLVLRARALNKALIAERQALSGLGETELLDDAEVRGRLRTSARALSELDSKIAEIDVADTVRKLTQTLETPLRATPPALRSVVATTARGPVTGHELADGLQRRREELTGLPRPGQADDLDAQRRSLARELEILRRLPDLRKVTLRKQANLEEAEKELQRLTGVGSGTYANFTDLLQQQEAARAELVEAGIELAQANAATALLVGLDPGVPEIVDDDDDDEDSDEYEGDDRDELDADPTSAARGGAPRLDRSQIESAWRALDLNAASALAAAGRRDMANPLLEGAPPELQRLSAELRKAQEAAEEARGAAEQLREEVRLDEQSWTVAAQGLAETQLRIRAAVAALGHDDRWRAWRPGVEEAFRRVGLPLTAAAEALEAVRMIDSEHGFAGPPSRKSHDADPEVVVAQVLSELGQLADAIAEAATGVRDGFSAMTGYLRSLAQQLSPRVAAQAGSNYPSDGLVQQALVPWVEHELSNLLSARELREELFERADRVTLDLPRMQVAWHASDGRPRRRPLEAFSSGEQVFAYTRAKLEQLRGLRNRHDAVVLVLDEFGAFVARDRFGQLMAFVRHEALEVIADQIIFMLPLAVDYLGDVMAAALEDGDGADGFSESGSVEDRVHQLRRREYFAVPAGYGP
jgi:hypothetical protein